MRPLRCIGIIVVLLAQLLACDDAPLEQRAVQCGIYVQDPSTCLAADSIDFGAVFVGDTALAVFQVTNFDAGPSAVPFDLNIRASRCAQFGWEVGPMRVEPASDEIVAVTFQPDSVGPFVCKLEMDPLCGGPVYLLGEGTNVKRPPLLWVRNNRPYEARFTVMYILNGSIHTKERALAALDYPFPPDMVASVELPTDATDIEIHVEAASGSEPDPWATVFRETYATPVRKCFELNYEGWSPAWMEVRCPYYPYCLHL